MYYNYHVIPLSLSIHKHMYNDIIVIHNFLNPGILKNVKSDVKKQMWYNALWLKIQIM